MNDHDLNDPDSEHRVAYVAAARTQPDLIICVENAVDWGWSQYRYPFVDPEKKSDL